MDESESDMCICDGMLGPKIADENSWFTPACTPF